MFMACLVLSILFLCIIFGSLFVIAIRIIDEILLDDHDDYVITEDGEKIPYDEDTQE